nr:MAG TPA: hypothetical protein [Caudoviricetes sp.]DAY42199.1 MAG TPA: hypothetical protein [Caudoviricetes sp.]
MNLYTLINPIMNLVYYLAYHFLLLYQIFLRAIQLMSY